MNLPHQLFFQWSNTFFKWMFVLMMTLLSATSVLAQSSGTYPARPIKIIVPYAPGGLPDTVARLVAIKLQEAIGQGVVVENRPGGNGAIAASALATSGADGYTLLVTDGSMMTINPLLSAKLGYDPKADFLPVSLIAQSPLFLAVNSSLPVNNLDEYIALVKKSPGKFNYGSSGIGSTHHLSMEAMKEDLGLFVTHIPYRGSSASVPAMVGNQVQMVFSAYPSLAGFVRSGQARIIATNGAKRSNLAPDVPSIAEKVPGYDFAVVIGLFAPKGTPNDIVQRLSNEVAKIAKRDDVVTTFRNAGIEAIGTSSEQLGQALSAESSRVTKAAKRANLKPE
jgi:tripartite-type tricarboxylate transporter receptor subunit TctC